MKIPENIRHIEVYYDGRCGMCCTFHEWVNRQPRAFAVRFAPYQSALAEEWFPGVRALGPEREMIVRTDTGEVYRGAGAWVLCLLSCHRYRWVARCLASPVLLPFAEKVCRALAGRRRALSKIFFRRKNREVSGALHHIPGQKCGGSSRVPDRNDIPDGII